MMAKLGNQASISSARPGAAAIDRGAELRLPGRFGFFQGMSVLLLAIVLLGFARTLFLRPLSRVPPIPWYLYVHGALLTCWFAMLLLQTSLVAGRRIDLHRRLGTLGAILAIATA